MAFLSWPVPEAIRHPGPGGSSLLVDRNGLHLREVLGPDHTVGRAVTLDRVAPCLVEATLLAEDRRFFWHPGVDPLAVLRSAYLNLRAGRVVSGGSTLTQQLARNLVPLPGTLQGKLVDAFYALRLEWQLSKREILELYLNRAPYGNQAVGVEAASELYFQRPASALSPAQAAFLAVLPRAPSIYNPYSNLEPVLVMQRDLLRRMGREGALSPEALRLALTEPISLEPVTGPFEAPHFCDLLGRPEGDEVRTTLDLPLQHEVEAILAAHLRRLAPQRVGNGAVVVMEVESGDVLAMVGSRDYLRDQVNGAVSLRQPGSTLKPFTYALALERGYTPATLLPDIQDGPTRDRYLPDNYDRRFHGPVRLREALACSYNVPAVRTLHEVGTEALLTRLRRLGFEHLQASPEHYGLGLTLGDGEVTLLELARAYRCLARGGVYSQERLRLDQPEGPEVRVLDSKVACLIGDILSDRDARIPAFGRNSPLNLPFPCAAKTGTSKGYRDNWTVGYSSGYVVAVWVGNFDAQPMVDVSGITGAGPLFHEVFMTLYRRGDPGHFAAFERPSGLEECEICPESGQLPNPDCPHRYRELFAEGTLPHQLCPVHRRVEGRRYEVYAPEYQPWMADRHMPMPPARPGSRPDEGGPPGPARELGAGEAARPDESGEVRVVFPENGDFFRIDPVLRPEAQCLRLKVVAPEDAARVSWVVDSTRSPELERPFAWTWQLRPGTHRIRAEAVTVEGKRQYSGPVTIEVR